MDTRKLIEALEDLRSKRAVLDKVIGTLEDAIRTLGSEPERELKSLLSLKVERHPRSEGRSSLDYAIEVLSHEGSIHVEELAKKVSQMAGREVSRATLDGGISREIRERGDKARFRRNAPGFYSLQGETQSQLYQ